MSMQLFLRCHCLRHVLLLPAKSHVQAVPPTPPESTCTADPPVTILAFHAYQSREAYVGQHAEAYAALYYHVYGRHPRRHHSPTLSPMPISDIEPYDRTPYRSSPDEPIFLLSYVQPPSLP